MKTLKKLVETYLKILAESPLDGTEGPSLGRHGIGTNDSKEFWGSRGAGIMPICPTTGNILLVLRGPQVNEPGTWGIPGGAIDGNESFGSAAKRELQEELSYSGQVEIHPAFQFQKGTFTFQNFFGVVPEEFEVQLDWENEDHGWFALNALPSPLHFGTKALLQNSMEQLTKLMSVEKTKLSGVGEVEITRESYQRWMEII
jgi:8-oxo-dGTP pyrophosphatase MutT (NUDIX family)